MTQWHVTESNVLMLFQMLINNREKWSATCESAGKCLPVVASTTRLLRSRRAIIQACAERAMTWECVWRAAAEGLVCSADSVAPHPQCRRGLPERTLCPSYSLHITARQTDIDWCTLHNHNTLITLIALPYVKLQNSVHTHWRTLTTRPTTP